MADKLGGNQNESRKRRKIALACERCRDRKIRCDGQMPSCGACERRSNSRDQGLCTYVTENSARSLQEQRYIRGLEERLRFLEARELNQNVFSPHVSYSSADDMQQSDFQQDLNRNMQTLLPGSPDTGPVQILGSETRQAVSFHQSISTVSGHVFKFSSQPENGREKEQSHTAPVGEESPVNAMGTATTTSIQSEAGHDTFYGTSSAVALFHQVQNHINRKGPNSPAARLRTSDEIAKSSSFPSAQYLENDGDFNTENLSLPPRSLADQLLEQYWQRVHCLFPIIHRKGFEAKYQQLWEAENNLPREELRLNVGLGSLFCPAPIFQSALNAMFALGCNFSDLSSAKRSDLSETFSRRSLGLLSGRFLDSGSLALVQSLLIVAQYLQSTDLPNRCWNVVGLAIRVAQGLGLHIEDPGTKNSLLETEIRRRTWHGCLMLDVLTGMTLGRPITVSRMSEFPLPLAVDDEFLGGSSVAQPPGRSFSMNEFFVQVLKLYMLMGEILEQVYRPWDHSRNSEHNGRDHLQRNLIHKIIDLEGTLSEFELSIPRKLHWDQTGLDSGDPPVLERQRNVLHTRFLHLKLLLYRPVFHYFLVKPDGSQQNYTSEQAQSVSTTTQGESMLSALDLLAQRYGIICVEMAQDLIALIERTMDSRVGGAWWYSIFYVFSSAMVLLLAEIRLPIRDSSTNLGIKTSWQECLNILYALSPKHNGAARCAETLIRMREQAVAKQTSVSAENISSHDSQPLDSTSYLLGESQLSRPVSESGVTSSQHARNVNSISSHCAEMQTQDFLWDKSGYPLQWDFHGQDWWGGLLDQV